MVALVLCYSFTSQYINSSFLHSRQIVMKLFILHRLLDRFYCISVQSGFDLYCIGKRATKTRQTNVNPSSRVLLI